MTIYIAGPMTGLPDYNRAAFNAKEGELSAKGWKVLNPAKIGDLPEYDMYWPINKAMLDGANAIYMLDGWEGSKGACAEHEYAAQNGILLMCESKEMTCIGRYIIRRGYKVCEIAPCCPLKCHLQEGKSDV